GARAEEVGDRRGDPRPVAAGRADQGADEARVRVGELALALDGHRRAQGLLDAEGEAGGRLVAGAGLAHAVAPWLVGDRRRRLAELGERRRAERGEREGR